MNLRLSLPTGERGLKLVAYDFLCSLQVVAPHGGAWIETNPHVEFNRAIIVAPHGGAWIETLEIVEGSLSR